MGRPLEYLIGITAFTCLILSVSAQADDEKKGEDGIQVRAILSGAQEVLGVDQVLIESAKIVAKFEKDLSAARVELTIVGGANVFAAHFHCGRAGQNGPVVVTLFTSGGIAPLMFDGVKASGTITNADLITNPCAIDGQPVNNIASLAIAMRLGLIYVNVHTFDLPGGEVRGQMLE
jgi:hypothetical protein